MKKIIGLFIMMVLMSSCGSIRNIPENSNSETGSSTSIPGTSFKDAVVIHKSNERDGVNEEYRWIAEHHPGYAPVSQALSDHRNKPYDIITIRNDQGEEMKVYFDISNFFGKF